jgi:hypothetical protein
MFLVSRPGEDAGSNFEHLTVIQSCWLKLKGLAELEIVFF